MTNPWLRFWQSQVSCDVLFPDRDLPASSARRTYVIASNGLFVRAERPELAASIPVAPCQIPGLAALSPSVSWRLPRINRSTIVALVLRARQARGPTGNPVEWQIALLWEEDRWRTFEPPQMQATTNVRQQLGEPGSDPAQWDAATIVELHSHHAMPAFFSQTDDADEQGFRIYAVLGEIFTAPTLLVRVGVYGHHWTIPAATVFELPEGIRDASVSPESGDALSDRPEWSFSPGFATEQRTPCVPRLEVE